MNSAGTASEPSTTSMAKRAIFVVGIVLQSVAAGGAFLGWQA
jgi:hypothetical protein